MHDVCYCQCSTGWETKYQYISIEKDASEIVNFETIASVQFMPSPKESNLF